jgi:hypothetical protein
MGYSEVFAGIDVILKLVPNQKCLEQGSTEIYRDVVRLVGFDFLAQVGRDIRGAKSKFDDVDMWTTYTHKLMDLGNAESFVHDHGDAGCAGLHQPIWHLGKMKIHEEKIITSSKLQKNEERG